MWRWRRESCVPSFDDGQGGKIALVMQFFENKGVSKIILGTFFCVGGIKIVRIS